MRCKLCERSHVGIRGGGGGGEGGLPDQLPIAYPACALSLSSFRLSVFSFSLVSRFGPLTPETVESVCC